jgi:hypothetical protein
MGGNRRRAGQCQGIGLERRLQNVRVMRRELLPDELVTGKRIQHRNSHPQSCKAIAEADPHCGVTVIAILDVEQTRLSAVRDKWRNGTIPRHRTSPAGKHVPMMKRGCRVELRKIDIVKRQADLSPPIEWRAGPEPELRLDI